MGTSFLEFFSGTKKEEGGFGVSPATVTDNLNVLSEGRVQVHIPAYPDLDPWARLSAVGGGPDRGFLWVPQVDDEVLVAFNKNDPRDVYVLGGLWSSMNRPPATVTTDFLDKRIIQTGLSDAPGHTIEFDDAEQSITITTSTEQTITMDATKIEIATAESTLKITLDLLGGITIEATEGDISLSAPAGDITISGLNVTIESDVATDISSDGTVSVEGTLVTLN